MKIGTLASCRVCRQIAAHRGWTVNRVCVDRGEPGWQALKRQSKSSSPATRIGVEVSPVVDIDDLRADLPPPHEVEDQVMTVGT